MKIAEYNEMMAYLTRPEPEVLPQPKPQELLDIQEDNRKGRLLDSLNKIGGRLEDSSLDFINRENFSGGGGGVTSKSLGGGLYENTSAVFGTKSYHAEIYDREKGGKIKKGFGTDREGALEWLKQQKENRPKTKFEKNKDIRDTKGQKELKKITDKIDTKFNKIKNKGYAGLIEFRKEMDELITKDKFRNQFEIKNKVKGYITDKFTGIQDVNTSKMEKAIDKYNKIGGKKRGTLKELAKEFDVNEFSFENNIQKTGRKKIPIKYGSEYEKRKAVSDKRKDAELKFSDSSFESKMSGSAEVQKSHMDDLYSKVVRADTLGYAPARINQEILKQVDPYLNQLYKNRDKLLKDKPEGYKQAVEEINQKGIKVAQATDGYKSFRIEQPDGKKYQFGVEPGKTIDPAGVLEGKEVKGNVEKVQFKPQTVVTEQLEGPDKGKITKEKFGSIKPQVTMTPKIKDQFLFEENRKAVMQSQSKVTDKQMSKVAKQLQDLGFKCKLADGTSCNNPMAYLDDIKKQQALAKGSGNAAANAAKKLSAGKAIMREFIGPAALGFELAAAVPITYLGYKAGLPPARIVADTTYGLFGETEKARLKKIAVDEGIDTSGLDKVFEFQDKSKAMQTLAQQEGEFRGPDDEMQFPQQYKKGEEDFYKAVGGFRDEEGNVSKKVYDNLSEQLKRVEDIVSAEDTARADERSSRIANFGIGDYIDFNSGGRVGFADGPDNPKRRTFMKVMAGIASIPILGKFFKGAKTAKVVKLSNTTTNMPDWFPNFVENAFTKGIGKKIDADLTELEVPELPGVKVLAHDDGRIRVEGKNAYDETYEIEYTPPGYEVVDEATGKTVKTPGEFQAMDTQFRRTGSPDEMDFDVDYEVVKDVDDILGGNATQLEGFAKGTNKTKETRGSNLVDKAEADLERADVYDPYADVDPTDFTDD